MKQWCMHYNINWLSQGSIGKIRYDWKIVIEKGKSAIFSSIIDGNIPVAHKINKREILIFPNLNKPKNNGKISETKFRSIIDWVNTCLDGNICEYGDHN